MTGVAELPTNDRRFVGAGHVRDLRAHWSIRGEVELCTPAHFGSGEGGDRADMELLLTPEPAGQAAATDALPGRPLLPGASLAGALRAHLLDRLAGFGVEPDKVTATRVGRLLGADRGDDEGAQSLLIVHEAIATEVVQVERRDGVGIDAERGTAQPGRRYDLELLPAGTRLPLELELLVPSRDPLDHMTGTSTGLEGEHLEGELLSLLAAALSGLAPDGIRLGARTTRGFGEIDVHGWRAQRHDLTTREGWCELLSRRDWTAPEVESAADAIRDAWPRDLDVIPDARAPATRIELTLRLDAPLLVAAPPAGPLDPDDVPLSWSGDGRPAVLPGTSSGGVLRARARLIAQRVKEESGLTWVNALFGHAGGPRTSRQAGDPRTSRVRISERPLTESRTAESERIRIDRHSGGVLAGALFEQRAVAEGQVEIHIELRPHVVDGSIDDAIARAEAGLLVLVVKDLVEGLVPAGGGAAIGRGLLGATRISVIRAGERVEADLGHPSPQLDELIRAFHAAPATHPSATRDHRVPR